MTTFKNILNEKKSTGSKDFKVGNIYRFIKKDGSQTDLALVTKVTATDFKADEVENNKVLDVYDMWYFDHDKFDEKWNAEDLGKAKYVKLKDNEIIKG